MIFEKIKQRSIRKSLENKPAKQRELVRKWPENMIIFFQEDMHADSHFFKRCAAHFNIAVENLTLLARVDDIKKTNISYAATLDYTTLKWNGAVSNALLKEVLNKSYGIQLNLYPHSDLLNDYISLKINSNIKVGFTSHDKNTFDLAIDLKPSKEEQYLADLKKYVTLITD